MTGAEFKAALESRDLTQAQFARAMSLAVTTVNRWCRGKTPVPVWAERWVLYGSQLGLIDTTTKGN